MKITLTFIAAFLFITVSFAQQTADSTQDPTALGNTFFKSMLDEDGATLGKLISSDFSLVSTDGNTVDGDMLTQALGGGILIVETATVSDAKTRQYNTDAAVMTGNWKVKGNLQGQAFDTMAVFSVVCAKQAGLWKIVNVQLTPLRQ